MRFTPALVTASAILVTVIAGGLPAQVRYDLLVSSRGTNSVKRFDGETGAYLDDLVRPGAGGLSLTQEVRIGPDHNLYVTGRGNSAVLRFDRRTGEFLGPVTSGYSLDQPTKMTVTGTGLLYVSQWGQTRSSVALFDATTGVFLREATPNLNQPMEHLVEPNGLLVADFESREVLRFGLDGAPLGPVTNGRSLRGPVNLWRHSSGDLLVIDWPTGTVERFDGITGAFRSTFVAGLAAAEGWTLGPDGRLYLCDWSRNLILRFDPETGAPAGVFASGGGLSQPNSLVFVERTPAFDVSLRSEAVTVAAGQVASVDVIVAADRGLAFPEPVLLTCTGLPAGWACNPARAAMPGATTDTVKLTIATPAALGFGPSLMRWIGLGALAMLVGLGCGDRRRRRIGVVALSAVAGCGGTPPSDPPDSSRVTIGIVANGAGLERMATLTVTVTR